MMGRWILLRALVCALLSLLFLVVYGGAGWITAQRADVRTWYFKWEMSIPFQPLMVIPYLSIDLFFMAAPFLCTGESELRILARRISFAILAAGVGFLLLPLRLGFERSEAGGLLGGIFGAFLHLNGP